MEQQGRRGTVAWQALFVWNFFWSLRHGRAVARNPWSACSLEWETPSPPPHGNFDRAITVERGPYEYSNPNRAADFHPQAREA